KDGTLVQKGWKIVQKNQGKIYHLVTDMLSYSKEREPAIEWTDLNGLVREVLEVVEGRAKEMNLRVQVQLAPGRPRVPLDAEGIQHALLNIVTNAIDAVEERRKPLVSVTTKPDPEAGWVRVVVVDNGLGIAPERQADIFRPFVSSKGAKGT